MTEIVPLRPINKKAWEWAKPLLNEDQTLPRDVVTPSKMGTLIPHASLSEAVLENGKLVDFKFNVLSRIMADYIGEKSGKMGKAALSTPMLERGLKTGQYALTYKKPCLIRANLLEKEHRRLEHLFLPVRVKGEVTQVLAFTDIWFPGV